MFYHFMMKMQEDNLKPELKPTKIPEHKPGAQGGKRDANRKEKTQQIADAALKLFLERGLEKVTIDDIVKAAGIAKGSFTAISKIKRPWSPPSLHPWPISF